MGSDPALAAIVGQPVRIVVEAGGTEAGVPAGRDDAPPPVDEDVDLDDLVDAPPVNHVSGVDRIASFFPGSEIIEETE